MSERGGERSGGGGGTQPLRARTMRGVVIVVSYTLDTDATALLALLLTPAMKALYPASNEIPSLPDHHLAIKIARHSRCSTCSTCPGLYPPPGWRVFLDTSDGDDSDDDGEPPQGYLNECRCGHDVSAHGADVSSTGHEEFARRGRVAVRLDELLEVRLIYHAT